MRRLAVLGSLVMLVGVAVPAAAGGGAQVVHKEAVPCDVGWSDDVGPVTTEDCWGTNVKTPDGRYVLVLKGQIPDERMDEFDGPLQQATACWANWFFVRDDSEEPAVTDSVRRFTPDGQMTEVCIYSP